ncbi:MAG: PAS domain S-box protein [Rhodocyclales bacterium GT-UBC]|nr:MAG: PAS domain S-box protein [Rhodocyclales bacterium GT-UBC]
MKHNFRLRSLLVAVLLVSNLLVWGLSGLALYNSRQQYESRAEALTQNIAKAVDQSLSNSIEKIDLALHAVADELERQLAEGGIQSAAMNNFMERQALRLPEVEAFRASDADGLVILGRGVNKADAVSWADRAYFIQLRAQDAKRVLITKPVMGRISRVPIIGFQLRYNFPDGRFAGVVSAPVTLNHFSQLLAQFSVGEHGTIVLRDADLGLIARIPALSDKPAGQVGNSVISPELRAAISSGQVAGTFYTPAAGDGLERMVSFSRLSRAPMFFAVGAAKEDYLAGWYDELHKTLALTTGYLLLSIILGAIILRLQREAERGAVALAEREMRLKTIIDNEPECIKVVDAEGRLVEMNSAGLKMIEADSMAQVALQRVTDLIVPEYRTAYIDMHRRVLGGNTATMEFEVRGLKGGRRWLETHAAPMNDNGQIMQLAITRDISERKKAEAELAQHRRNLEQLVEERSAALMATEAWATHIVQSSADGLFGVDADGRITFINPAACAMLGYSAEAVIGQLAHPLFHHSRPDGTPYLPAECPSFTALRDARTIRVDDEVYWHADGHAIPVMYAIHPLSVNGRSSGAVISFVDMSALQAAARAREQALQEAENLARMRSEFLANMSHEIRTPLNGVLGFAEIGLKHYQNAPKAQESFRKIVSSGKRLLGVINDILDFSKIEAGKLTIEQTEVSIWEVVDHVLELVRDRAQAKHLDLRISLSPDLPTTCLGDPLRLGQVLLNVLSNAIKFTERGHVALSVALQDERLVFRVSDTGVGMDEAQMQHLFTPFHQADASASRRFGGTGLGLAICRQLLQLMAGEISLSSQAGQGTTVEFHVPYCPAPIMPPVSAVLPGMAWSADKPLAGLSFLVAEDEVINQEILYENLVEDGARVVVVDNGRAAVERIARDGRAAYDLVLMDIQMPEMDGYEATRRILEMAPDLPIIAQTAHAFNEERERCFAAGMVGHVAKPFDSNELIHLVRQHVPARSGKPIPLADAS